MRTLIAVNLIALVLSPLAFAAPSEKKLNEYKQDYLLVCEISSLAKAMASAEEFKDKAERTTRVHAILDAALKTREVKKAVKLVLHSKETEKGTKLQESAEKLGLESWTCPTLEYLAL